LYSVFYLAAAGYSTACTVGLYVKVIYKRAAILEGILIIYVATNQIINYWLATYNDNSLE